MTDFEDIISAPMPCPKCGKEFAANIRLLKTHNTIPCPDCGTVIDLTDPQRRAYVNEFSKAIASVMPRFEDIAKKR